MLNIKIEINKTHFIIQLSINFTKSFDFHAELGNVYCFIFLVFTSCSSCVKTAQI